MLATLIIVFREVLEAGLVIGIVMAASRGIKRRGWWIAAGCGAGVLGAVLVAWFANELAAALEGVGQEVFNASILLTAVCMLGWHNIWMSRHGRALAADATRLGREVAAGTRSLYAMAVVCGIAVLREGSEVVLFLYGIAAAGGGGGAGMLLGGVLGLLAGAAIGVAIYYGLLAVPLRQLFGVTSWLILLLAAGMASQAAAFLAAAELLPSLGNSIWDTSRILPDRNLIGQLLHVLVGYTARPAGIQLVFYAGALILIGSGMRIFGRAASDRESGRTEQPAE
ncbi:MAG: FTR1 family protein [Alphaproteobacteria bacterium]|nr:FTR1 family protein [Betaproteobacteria bacterium]MDE2075043.1 FTR1 family protein [Alphaproteobacteria bacterium]